MSAEQTQRGESIRVVVGEDNYLIREGIRQALAGDNLIEIVGMAEDRDSLRSLIMREKPDVVLTDIRMPPTGWDEGIQIASLLREMHSPIGVVLLSHFIEPDYALRLLEHGSSGRAYLLKDRIANRPQLVATIREVAAGGSVIDPKVVEALVGTVEAGQKSLIASLSAREREVLAAIAGGKSNAAIASSLHLSKPAVEKHVNSIFHKLELAPETEVSRRVMATLLYLASG